MIGNCGACLFVKYEGMGKEKMRSKTENYCSFIDSCNGNNECRNIVSICGRDREPECDKRRKNKAGK